MANELPTNHVFYISPAFVTNEEFDINYQNNSIYDNSVKVPCGSLNRIEASDEQCITYSAKTSSPGYTIKMHSEPQIIYNDG